MQALDGCQVVVAMSATEAMPVYPGAEIWLAWLQGSHRPT